MESLGVCEKVFVHFLCNIFAEIKLESKIQLSRITCLQQPNGPV